MGKSAQVVVDRIGNRVEIRFIEKDVRCAGAAMHVLSIGAVDVIVDRRFGGPAGVIIVEQDRVPPFVLEDIPVIVRDGPKYKARICLRRAGRPSQSAVAAQ